MKTHSNYEVFEEIGRGAKTVVYAGYNHMTKRNVAIKEVADSADPDQMRSLQDTARFLAELPDYTHITEVKDLIPENGWLVLDRMRESLADRLTREKRGMSADLVRNVLRQTLRGLSVLHGEGRWVGNIRPSNLLVNDDGQVKIGDSPGLVADGVVRAPDGRSKYLAPERIESSFGDVGPWTDLYNLGFTALELLKGPKFDELFTGTGADAINPDVGWMRVHGSKVEKMPLASEVVRGLPSDLGRVIDRMLQKDVAKRYPSADAALAELGGGEEDIPLPTDSGSARVEAEPVTPKAARVESSPAGKVYSASHGVAADPESEPKKKPWLFIGIAGILGLALLVVIIIGLIPPDEPEAARITIKTVPPGAKITLLDVNKELPKLTPEPVVVSIKGKPRPIRLELDGYEPVLMDIDPAKTTEYEATFTPKPPPVTPKDESPVTPAKLEQVTVETNPAGAKLVWRDAETTVPVPTASGPFNVEPKDGPRQARLELPGYEPLNIEIDPAKQKQYKFDLKPANLGDAIEVRIVSKPVVGYDIFVDDKPEGKTPRTLMLVPNRVYRIGVSRPGSKPEYRTIDLKPTDREFVWNIELPKDVSPKDDPQLVADLQACDDAFRRGKPLAEYLKSEAPGKFARWQKGSDAGSIQGDILVAHCLSEGISTKKDEVAAVELYRKAVEHPTGAYWLGVMHDDGKGGLKQDVTEAAKFFRKAADGGHAPAMYALGRMRQTGRDGDKKDESLAADWFRKAAAADHPAGTYNLAVMTETGLGVKQDLAAAFELYRKAASLDFPAAMNNLGLMYKSGKGTEKDETKAAELFNKAAELGNREGMFNVGQAFMKGSSTEDKAAAAMWFEKAAAAGHPGAMTNLGVMYLTGKGGQKVDEAAAVELFRKAAAANHPAAMHNLGLAYQAGKGGLKADEVEAAAWFTKSAEAGEPNAMNSLGVMLQEGRGGLAKDEMKASEWFSKGATLGNRDAMYNLGQTLVKKDSLADQTTAVEWYTKAADLGQAAAMNNLAVMHETGKGGLRPDAAKAVELYQKSADLNYPPAMYHLGMMHLGGKGGLKVDQMAAFEWLRKSADGKYPTAMYQLGLMYQKGTGGVPKDAAKANEWFMRAAENGHKGAKEKLGS